METSTVNGLRSVLAAMAVLAVTAWAGSDGVARAGILISDDFDNGTLATGGSNSVNGGFYTVGNGVGSPTYSESNSLASITAGSSGASGAGISSISSFDPTSLSSFTVNWVINSCTIAPANNGLNLVVGSSSSYWNSSKPYADFQFTASGTSGTMSLYVSNTGSNSKKDLLDVPFTLSDAQDGFQLAATYNQTGWSYTTSGLNTLGSGTAGSGTWATAGTYSYASVFTNRSYVGADTQNNGTTAKLKVDSITVSDTGMTTTWTGTYNSSWAGNGNWDKGSPAAGYTAVFSGGTQSAVSLGNAAPSLAGITFNNSTASYTLAQGSGTTGLTLNSAGTAALVTVLTGTHSITAPITLSSNTDVSPIAGTLLDLAGNISGSGALTLDGPGELILTGTNSYSGGTIVDSGTLIVNTSTALLDGSSLAVGAGGVFIFDPSVSAAPLAGRATAAGSSGGVVEAVPEPGTWTLLAAAIAAMLGGTALRRGGLRGKSPENNV